MRKRNIGIILSYINTFLNMVCGLFLSSFLLRSLGDADYGVYQTVSSFANYLVLLEFGTGTVMVRNISICRGRNATQLEIEKNISTIWTITNVLAIAIAAVSVVFYATFDSIYSESLTPEQIADGKNIFIFVTIYLLASFYVSTLNSVALAFERYTLNSKIAISRNIIRTGLLVALVLAIKDAIVIAIVDATFSLTVGVFLYIYCIKNFKIKINFRNFDKAIFKTAFPLCAAIFLQTFVNQANSTVAKFVTGIKLSPESVSLYSVALYIYNIFSSLTTLPISMYAPQITKDVANGMENKELTEKMIQPSRLIVLIGGAVMFGFIAAGKQFISIVYGDNYLQAWLIAIIIMMPMFINMSNGILINVLDAKNKRMARSVILTFTTAINVALTIFMIEWKGVVGAAISTGVCTLLGQVLLMNIYYFKVIKINVIYMFFKTYRGILIYQIIGALAAYFVGTLISNVYLSFIVSGVLFVLIAFGGFALLGKNDTEKATVGKILSKFRRKKC